MTFTSNNLHRMQLAYNLLCPPSKKVGHNALLLSVSRPVNLHFPFIFFTEDEYIEMKFGYTNPAIFSLLLSMSILVNTNLLYLTNPKLL